MLDLYNYAQIRTYITKSIATEWPDIVLNTRSRLLLGTISWIRITNIYRAYTAQIGLALAADSQADCACDCYLYIQ